MATMQVSCCFSGHRPGKLPWGYREEDPRCAALKDAIAAMLEKAYDDGYRHFICGMALGCDLYFCEEALRLRARRPDVTVEAAVPCRDQAARWAAAQRVRYEALLAQCDRRTLLQERYDGGCMQRRNRYMVDHSALLIAVHDGSPGGTLYTIEYALRCRRHVLVLPPVGSAWERKGDM